MKCSKFASNEEEKCPDMQKQTNRHLCCTKYCTLLCVVNCSKARNLWRHQRFLRSQLIGGIFVLDRSLITDLRLRCNIAGIFFTSTYSTTGSFIQIPARWILIEEEQDEVRRQTKWHFSRGTIIILIPSPYHVKEDQPTLHTTRTANCHRLRND